MMAELNAGPGGFQAVELPGAFAAGGGGGGGSGGHQSKAMAQAAGGGGFGADAGGWKFVQDSGGAAPAPAGANGGAPAKKVLTPVEFEVEKLVTMKTAPKRVELALFLTAVSNVVADSRGGHTWEEVASAMDAALNSKNGWQQRLNALTAVEYVLRAEEPKPDPSFRAYFAENPEDVQRNVVVVQEALKEKAQSVLRLLGVPDREEVARQQAAARAAAATTAVARQPAATAGSQAAQTSTTYGGNTSWSSGVDAGGDASAAGGLLEGMTVKGGAGGGGGGRAGVASQGKEPADKTKLKRRGPVSLSEMGDLGAGEGGSAAAPASAPAAAAPTTAAAGFGSWGAEAGAGWGAAPAATSAWPSSAPTQTTPAPAVAAAAAP